MVSPRVFRTRLRIYSKLVPDEWFVRKGSILFTRPVFFGMSFGVSPSILFDPMARGHFPKGNPQIQVDAGPTSVKAWQVETYVFMLSWVFHAIPLFAWSR